MTWRAQYLDDFKKDAGGSESSSDGGDRGKFYVFPDLNMCCGPHRTYIGARMSAEETVKQMEADGDTFDPFTNKLVAPETEPYYDDGRPEGYRGPTPRNYRWKDMFRFWKKAGRKLTREETAMFEEDEPYETDAWGKRYDHMAIIDYAWKMKRPLKAKEYGMFLIKGDGGTDDGKDDDYIPLF